MLQAQDHTFQEGVQAVRAISWPPTNSNTTPPPPSEVVHIETHQDDVSGREVILWSDILDSFKNVINVRHSTKILQYLKGSDFRPLDPLRIAAIPNAILDVYIDTQLPQTDVRTAVAVTAIPSPPVSSQSTPSNSTQKRRNPAYDPIGATDNASLNLANITISPRGPQFVPEETVNNVDFYDHSANGLPTSNLSQLSALPGTDTSLPGFIALPDSEKKTNTVNIKIPNPAISANSKTSNGSNNNGIHPGADNTIGSPGIGLERNALLGNNKSALGDKSPQADNPAVGNRSPQINNPAVGTRSPQKDNSFENSKSSSTNKFIVISGIDKTLTSAQQTPHTPVEDISETIILAKAGDIPAQVRLGQAYKDGSHGLAQNYTSAMSWFRRAAEKGDASAQFGMAQMYELDQSAFQYKATAKTWYHKAAEQGHVDAQKSLGALYYMEKSGSYPQALEWYLKAAEQGDKNAQYNVGRMYNNGQGTPQDNARAMEWYGKAADQGHLIAKENYNFLKKRGHSIK